MIGRGRSVYFKDKFWKKAQKFARSKGLSVSTWIRGLIEREIANAHLITAAPDMLEALEEIANHKQDSFTMTHSCEHDPMENYYDVKEIAGSAIRKAKGGMICTDRCS